MGWDGKTTRDSYIVTEETLSFLRIVLQSDQDELLLVFSDGRMHLTIHDGDGSVLLSFVDARMSP